MFDRIVITAANEAQARGYRAQTKDDPRVAVIPDPGGRRVGSLGATVNAIRTLKLDGGKVLVCHSGGDARRTPGYAAMGKAFIPMPGGRSMYSHIVETMERLSLPPEGGMVVCSGDVLLDFDFAAADFTRPGVTGVAYPGDAFQARRHGVYLISQDSQNPGQNEQNQSACHSVDSRQDSVNPVKSGPVAGFLQKPQVAEGVWLIDTGILFIDWPTVRKMAALPIAGDIYDEFPRMLLAGFAPFSVNVAPECTFTHVGSSRELLDLLGDGGRYMDAVHCPVTMAGSNIATNIPPGRFERLDLAEGECITCLPLAGGGWYDLRYRIDDNFKTDGLWEKHGLAVKMAQIDYPRLLAIRRQQLSSAKAPFFSRRDAEIAEPQSNGGSSRTKSTTPTKSLCSSWTLCETESQSLCGSASSASLREKKGNSAVRVELPLRIDLAGGWSDTPPICVEKGGAVLNAAVTLEGCLPVVAEVRRIGANEVRVESVDLGERGVLTRREDVYAPKDPSDWCALVKSALAVTGYEFPQGGLEIRISANVPKGSGMGTSSILGAALVQALEQIAGRHRTPDEIARLTLRLEQEMQTGGGWQDQMGALFPGVKLVETAPGTEQIFRVRRLSPAAEEAFARFVAERGVLYFTGQKRMARNVLRGVLAFYASNPNGIAHAIVESLKRGATDAFAALERGDFDAFAAAVNDYWTNKKALDPGSTNPQVESIIARIAPWTRAVTLAGAGGGGFLFAIAKSCADRSKIEQTLAAAGNGGRAYQFAIGR